MTPTHVNYTPDFYAKQATKYALILDDIALKSTKDQDRWLLGRAAILLRELCDKIKDQDHGEAKSSAA